jgi:dihydrofolate reductase
VVENLTEAGGFLLGRRTYKSFAGHWPNAGEEEQVLAQPLNTLPKYVASTTLTEPLDWENSTLLKGDVAEAVAALKQEEGRDLLVIGSSELVHTLIQHNLVDGFRLMIDPLLVGGGKRIFLDDGGVRALQLVNSQVTTTGAILATYARAGGPILDSWMSPVGADRRRMAYCHSLHETNISDAWPAAAVYEDSWTSYRSWCRTQYWGNSAPASPRP